MSFVCVCGEARRTKACPSLVPSTSSETVSTGPVEDSLHEEVYQRLTAMLSEGKQVHPTI